jgi:hypothetical protein
LGSSSMIQEHGMPLVSTCSIAISAACHAPDEDTDATWLPVQWGVVTMDKQVPARCSFTTLKTVRPPQKGERIAGKKKNAVAHFKKLPPGKWTMYWRRLTSSAKRFVPPLKRWNKTSIGRKGE